MKKKAMMMMQSSEVKGQLTETFFDDIRVSIDEALDKLIPAEVVEPTKLHQAIRWSVFAGGKRFRPALVLAVGFAFGAKEECLMRTACAFEMIHTYSLIHDDLPAMDDDDLRRGVLTCHKKFDEATAILAGDVLQTLAFQSIIEDENLSADVRVKLINELVYSAGTPNGMAAGQCYDLDAESREVSTEELEQIHRKKTGALIRAAARSGAIIANANDLEIDAITQYAECLGLLFQITDDLLDVTSTAEDLGKTPGKDERAQKATYPSLYGIDHTQKMADDVYQEAISSLEMIDVQTNLLLSIAGFIRYRRF